MVKVPVDGVYTIPWVVSVTGVDAVVDVGAYVKIAWLLNKSVKPCRSVLSKKKLIVGVLLAVTVPDAGLTPSTSCGGVAVRALPAHTTPHPSSLSGVYGRVVSTPVTSVYAPTPTPLETPPVPVIYVPVVVVVLVTV
jgi:hypothetical protein